VKNKNKSQLTAELRALRTARTYDGWVVVLQYLIRWGAIVFIARYGYFSIAALSGEVTLAEVGISFFGKVEVSVAVAWTFGLVGGIYGIRQRKLRKDTVERLQGRISELERIIDKGRSSSRITSRGNSRPEDMI